MYKKIIFILLFLSLKNFVYASATDNYFKKANELYKNKEYSQSLEIYNKIYNEGFYSSNLFYNISNAYYRIGKIGEAMQFIEKAYMLSPRDSDINYNRKMLLQKTNQRIDFSEHLIGFFTINELLIFGLIFYSLFFIFLFVSRYYDFRWLYWLKFSIIVILVVNIFWIYSSYLKFYRYKHAIVLDQEVNVYSGPDETNTISCVVPVGQRLVILEDDNEWFDIGINEKGVRGFVKRGTVGII